MTGAADHIQTALASAPLADFDVAVIATGWTGEIGYWNRSAQTHYGWCAEEVLGRNIVDVLVLPEASGEAGEIMERLRVGEPWAGRFPVRVRSGEALETFVIDTPLLQSTPALCAIVGVSAPALHAERVRERNEVLLYELRGYLERMGLADVTAPESGVAYRFYLLDAEGKICRARDGRFGDDQALTEFAQRYLRAAPVYYPALEIWCGRRRVGRIER